MLKKRQQTVATQRVGATGGGQNVILDLASVDMSDIPRDTEGKYPGFGGGYGGHIKENGGGGGGSLLTNMRVCICAIVLCITVFYFAGFKLTLRKADDKKAAFMSEVKAMDTRNTSQCTGIKYDLKNLHSQHRLVYNALPKAGSLGMDSLLEHLKTKLHYTTHTATITDYKLARFHYSREKLAGVIGAYGFDENRVKKSILHHTAHFIDFSWFGLDTPYYINVIRDPVEHYISWYHHRREVDTERVNLHPLGHNDAAWAAEDRDMSFEDCVRSSHPECTESEYTFQMIPFFCGQDEYCLTPSFQSLQQAKRNVVRYFPVLGYVENMEAFLELSQVIWPQYFTGSLDAYHSSFDENANNAHPDPSEQVKEIMRARMVHEYDFYQWVKQRFNCMYKEYVLAMPQRQQIKLDSANINIEKEQVEAEVIEVGQEQDDEEEEQEDLEDSKKQEEEDEEKDDQEVDEQQEVEEEEVEEVADEEEEPSEEKQDNDEQEDDEDEGEQQEEQEAEDEQEKQADEDNDDDDENNNAEEGKREEEGGDDNGDDSADDKVEQAEEPKEHKEENIYKQAREET